MAFVVAEKIAKSYQVGQTSLSVLRDLDLSVEPGEMLAIVGASGVGKSTLLHVLGGLDRVDRGTVTIASVEVTALADGEIVAFRNRRVGFVFQFHHLLPEFSAVENAMMPLLIAGENPRAARERAAASLTGLGLASALGRRPTALSGGEQQRVAIARAVAGGPALLLADEPTGNLDARNAGAVFDLLLRLHQERGMTTLLATHSEKLAARCTRVLTIEAGSLTPSIDGR